MYSHQQWQLPPESEGKDQDPPTKDASYPLQDSWDRPEGEVSLVTVMSEGEKVKFKVLSCHYCVLYFHALNVARVL